jgi:hypothetical protein
MVIYLKHIKCMYEKEIRLSVCVILETAHKTYTIFVMNLLVTLFASFNFGLYWSCVHA